MAKIIEKIKKIFSCKFICRSKKEEEAKPQQEEPKAEEKPEEPKTEEKPEE